MPSAHGLAAFELLAYVHIRQSTRVHVITITCLKLVVKELWLDSYSSPMAEGIHIRQSISAHVIIVVG